MSADREPKLDNAINEARIDDGRWKSEPDQSNVFHYGSSESEESESEENPMRENIRTKVVERTIGYYVDTLKTRTVEVVEITTPCGLQWFSKKGKALIPMGYVLASDADGLLREREFQLEEHERAIGRVKERLMDSHKETLSKDREIVMRGEQVKKLHGEIAQLKSERRAARLEVTKLQKLVPKNSRRR